MSDDATQKAFRRDQSDVGRILASLMGKNQRGPDEIVDEYLSSDLKRFRRDLVLIVPELLPLIITKDSRVLTGGGGVVFQCRNRDIPQLAYALKVPRPSLLKGRITDVQKELNRATDEYYKHAPLSHGNIARVFGAGKVELPYRTDMALTLHPILMEWIVDAKPLLSYVLECIQDWRAVLSVIKQVFQGLAHLHSRHLIHWDIKSDNILVDGLGCPKIVDIGNARRSNCPTSAPAYSTRHNLPPPLVSDLAADGRHRDSSRHTAVAVPGVDWESPWIDLWMTARELNRVFVACESTLALDRGTTASRNIIAERRNAFIERVFPSNDVDAAFALSCIRMILKRLLASQRPSPTAFYQTADSVVADIRKLSSEFGAAQPVEELHAIPQKVIRLPASGNAPYSHRIAPIFNSSLVRRVTRHLQLGTLIQVYPGAAHRRSEHLAGVLARTMQYVRALYSNRSEPFWRLSIERHDIDALILSTLLHDVGHMAYGHVLEEMVSLLRGHAHEDYASELLCLDPSDTGMTTSADERADLRLLLARAWNMTEEQTRSLLREASEILHPPDCPTAASSESQTDYVVCPVQSQWLKTRLLHSIIDSAIDADKLDYLVRDAHHCGVMYANGVDIERFYQALVPILVRDDGEAKNVVSDAVVGVSEKGVLPVESILVARYQMFSSVYWHHTARAHAAMLQFAIQSFVGDDELSSSRVAELASVFRTEHDSIALSWLKERLLQGANQLAHETLDDICDALSGVREKLYWPAFELRYEPRGGDPVRISRCFSEIASELNKAGTPGGYVRAVEELRGSLSRKISKALRNRIVFAPGDVLLDLPPPGRDQVDRLWVAVDGRLRPIHDLSPVADSVRSAFQLWVRRIRVFLSPSAWTRLEVLGVSPDEIHRVIWGALLEITREKDPQTSLPLEDQMAN